MPHVAVCRTLLPLLLLSACASPVPDTGFAEPQAIARTIERYYEDHASEENQTCLNPYIDGLTRVTVVEQQPDRLVLDARYLYRDRLKNDNNNGLGGECTGYAGRQFTLEKNDAGFQVVGMSDSWR
jgi:hypothetical protein